MSYTMRLAIWAPVLLMGLSACSKKKGDAGSAEDSTTTVTSADGPWRGTVPADTTPPVVNAVFWGQAGSRLGAIKLNLKYPGDKSDYAKIEIRRVRGSVVPADCSSGTVVSTITDFSITTLEDTDLFPGGTYSYIACLSDAAGNSEAAYGYATSVSNNTHRMFATSATFDGNLTATYQSKTFTTGFQGGDYRCQYLATAAGLKGSFISLLSTADNQTAYDHVPIYGPIYDMKSTPELLAEGKVELWGGHLQHAPSYDETGTVITASSYEYAWTGTLGDGTAYSTSHCSGFTTNSSSVYGYLGDTLDYKTSGSWAVKYSNPCSTLNRLYCVETYSGAITAPTLTVAADSAAATADVTVTFPTDTSAYGSVRLIRQQGKAVDNPNCDETLPGSSVVKIYSASDGFSTETVTDKTLGDGYYNYLACVLDASGNVVGTSTSPSVTLGSSFKLAFISSASYAGNLGGVSGANTKCQTLATAASLSGTWKAMLGTTSTSIASNTGAVSTNIYDVAGNFLTSNVLGSPYYLASTKAIAVNETGATVAASTKIWVGATYLGAAGVNDCHGWTDSTTSYHGDYGVSRTAYGEWLYDFQNSTCDQTYPIYCIQN